MRHIFIVNPAAGKKDGLSALRKQVERVFPQGGYEIYTTAGPGDARTIAQRAIRMGDPVRLYACGGDGTLNEVVNAAAGQAHVAVTNIPMGTGNDFLRIFGKEGRRRFGDVAALRDGPQKALDLMDCNGLLGLNIVCAGVDARVAAEVHRFKRLPLVGHSLAYVLSLIATVTHGLTRPMEVTMGPIRHSGETALLCVCNAQYYGGGFRPMPEAMPDDGVLDMLLAGNITAGQFLTCVDKFARGQYRKCPDLIQSWHGDAVSFSSHDEMVVVVDGEVMRGREFTVCRSEKKLNFFWPRGVEFPTPTESTAGTL